MKQDSFRMAGNVSLTPAAPQRGVEVYDPLERRDQLNRSFRRRMSDDLETLIRKACQRGHIGTAEELLIVLRNLIAWEKQYFPHGRRPIDGLVDQLAAQIATAKAQRDAA